MSKKPLPIVTVTLDKIVGGGQALGTLEDGRKLFAWGGLPGETVEVQLTKKKSNYAEGVATNVITASNQRVTPHDPESYISTSPWQIMSFDAEQHYKAALIEEAFELHNIVLPDPITIYTDGREYHYRNKVEFSWYGTTDPISSGDTLDLAFFRRGSKGKITIDACALLPDTMIETARTIRDILQNAHISARQLKTLLIRCDQSGRCVWQLYVKDADFNVSIPGLDTVGQGGEIIYSNPKSPASVTTERLASTGNIVLSDTVLGVPFRYATEGFFQINLPVYEQALRDMQQWIEATPARAATDEPLKHLSAETSAARVSPGAGAPAETRSEAVSKDTMLEEAIIEDGDDAGELDVTTKPVLDLYSGVGSIGLTIGGENVTLVEMNEHAVREMKRNIAELNSTATAVLAASENALDYITSDKTIIVDPPRAGLHQSVINRLLQTTPERIIYLSCNPVTQARDVARLSEKYGVRSHQGYNFFPRTPHIEHLIILDHKP